MRPDVDLEIHSAALLLAAERLADAAREPGSAEGIPVVMDATRDALRAMSAACYSLAADAAPDVAPQPFPLEVDGPPPAAPDAPAREWQMALTGTLHVVASSMAQASRLSDAAAERASHLLERQRPLMAR